MLPVRRIPLIYFTPDFVHNNTFVKNNYILDDYCKLEKDMRFNVQWYLADDAEMLRNAIINDEFFRGILIKDNDDFENFYCSFCKVETASDYDINICFKENFDGKAQIIDSILKLIEEVSPSKTGSS